jgi:hypothetical protein
MAIYCGVDFHARQQTFCYRDAAGVRRPAKRRQKNDRRDASLILDLLLKGEFPQVHRRN